MPALFVNGIVAKPAKELHPDDRIEIAT